MTNIFNIISDQEVEVALVRRIKVGDAYRISNSYSLLSIDPGVVTVTGIYENDDPRAQHIKEVEVYVYMEGLDKSNPDYSERLRYYNSCMWVEYNYGSTGDYDIRMMDLELFAEHISRA